VSEQRGESGSGGKEALLDFCRALPGATEDVKWVEHLVFSVGGKMFAIFDVSASEAVRFKVDPAVYPILIRTPGIGPGPHLSHHQWVKADHASVLPLDELRELLRESHLLVAEKLSKKLRRSLGIGQVPGAPP
jgi:predicted DNA-binding protein (MmcQ/YjbR family)